jgi:antitoxin component HigA of HigAB toxin-antitoxin module
MSDEVEIFRARIVSLGLSHSAVDRILGKAGYTNKVMNRKKRLGAKVAAELASALAMKREFVIDADREALMQAEWERWRRK